MSRKLCDDSNNINLVYHVVAEDGEGIIMRKCRSLYEPGKSSSLLKVKVG